MERIFYDGFFLIVIKPGSQQEPGMVIHRRGQIGLYPGAVFPNGKLRPVLDIPLDQHHAVRLAEAFGRTLPRVTVYLHLFPSVTSPVQVPSKSGAFQDSRCSIAFQFQDADDLCDRPLRDFLTELDRLLKQKIKVFPEVSVNGVFRVWLVLSQRTGLHGRPFRSGR